MNTSEGDHDPATILVVEDDAGLRKTLVATLKAASHRPIEAANAAEALRWFAHYAPDLVLLDLGLPDRDGMSVITYIRQSGPTPIIVLSARDAEAAKVEALDKGADDYVTKPFGVPELLARIRAALRHGVQARGSLPVISVGQIEIDLGARRVLRDGIAVRLSPKEYDLLAELAIHHGRPVRHSDLLRSVWGSERADLHYLRVYIGQLRTKLEDDPSHPILILAEPGVGYRLATA
jgi:two-component system, OmpR family, KDP operon response regulator KdpE